MKPRRKPRLDPELMQRRVQIQRQVIVQLEPNAGRLAIVARVEAVVRVHRPVERLWGA